ncbi:MAG: 1-deoxy-D-xylulose-5-phosphate reductoisomerase [Bacilli bacterium]|jgi:1-deoxy-D-xylulose-5-phosphate reductoisomerase|nr:1-deoxy-D-xylulose-5-phosphate reductoisomerase [Bacilli bacterium]
MRTLCLLGASGNVGSQSLDLIGADPASFCLKGISVGHQVAKIPAILRRFPSITYLCVEEETDAASLRAAYPKLNVFFGEQGLVSLIEESDCAMVENALVGFVGLVPTLTALRLGKILCLSNKESLVVGGELVKTILATGRGVVYPIDSEHVALSKCLRKVNVQAVDKLIVTASGGAFRNLRRDELNNVTPAMALRHPTWKMGPKITIDSATMMNKGFELIEAHYLFDWPLSRMEIVLHDESEVHSALRLKDGSYVADVGPADMKGPIAYALYEGKKPYEAQRAKTLNELGPFHFRKFVPERYPAVGMCLDAFSKGGTAPCVLNAANEVADRLFLEGKMPFLSIERACALALREIPHIMKPTLRDLLRADAYARMLVERRFGGTH